MDATTSLVIDNMASTTGSLFNSVFPLFYLVMGFFIVIFVLSMIIKVFRSIKF